MNKERLPYIDTLRCMGIIAVLMQHAARYYIDFHSVSSFANALRGMTRWNILIFVMITGSLFLSRDLDYPTMWRKYIARLVRVFMVWSVGYSALNLIINKGGGNTELIKYFISDLVSGGTRRMWYLVMMIALYSFIPLIALFVRNASTSLLRYSIVLTGCLASLLPSLMLVGPINTVFGLDLMRISGVFSSIYVFYLILGWYWIGKDSYGDKEAHAVIILGICSIVCMGIYHYVFTDLLDSSFILCLPITMMLVIFSKRIKGNSILRSIADCSFGIYLIHTFIQYALQFSGVEMMLFNSGISGLVIYILVLFMVSWSIILLIRKTAIGRAIT